MFRKPLDSRDRGGGCRRLAGVPAAHWLAWLAALLVTPTAATAAICLSGITILNPAPILIPCGARVLITGSATYTIVSSSLSWGNCWAVAPPRSFTAQLYDDDGILGEELYGQTTITVPAGPTTGTLTFNIPLVCTYDPQCPNCLVNGDENTAELFLAFWAQLVGPGSPVKTARCVCGQCVRALRVEDFDAAQGALAQTDLVMETPFVGISAFDVTLSYSSGGITTAPLSLAQESFSAPSLTFTDPTVQAATTVQPVPGGVRFFATFDPPIDLGVGTFATLSLFADLVGPPEEVPVVFTPASTFLDAAGSPVESCLVRGIGRILPADSLAPMIDGALIEASPCFLAGRPGSVLDDYLGVVPGYVEIGGQWQGNLLGLTRVRPDGSFLFPNVALPGGSQVTLTAADQAGNSSQATVTVAQVCDCNGNGVPDDEDLLAGTSEDCNANLVPDECDLADGFSQDSDGDGIPDECEASVLEIPTLSPFGLVLSALLLVTAGLLAMRTLKRDRTG